jgi:hypothetical protein
MQIKRRVLTAGTTFFLAAATGHMMQNGDVIGSRFLGGKSGNAEARLQTVGLGAAIPPANEVSPATVTELSADVAVPERSVPVMPGLPATQPRVLTTDTALPVRVAALDAGLAMPDATSDAAKGLNDFGLACAAPEMTVTAAAPAMLNITLAAPCAPNARVTLRHAALIFAARTDASGNLSVSVPALAPDGVVKAGFMSGTTLEARKSVPDIAAVSRSVLQWRGAADLRLNAYEYSAAFGSAGHIRTEAPRAPDTALGGYLTVLGDAELDRPLMAQVYTAPAGMTDVALEVESKITTADCGTDASARMLRLEGGELAIRDITIAMPGCDAVGDMVLMALPRLELPVSLATAGN